MSANILSFDIEALIFAELSAVVDGRLYPDILPENITLPAFVYTVTAGETLTTNCQGVHLYSIELHSATNTIEERFNLNRNLSEVTRASAKLNGHNFQLLGNFFDQNARYYRGGFSCTVRVNPTSFNQLGDHHG